MSNREERCRGAKDALLNSTMYYRQALLQLGCKDINREIATEVGKALILSEEQIEFIASSKKPSANEIIDNAEILLKHMVYKNAVDKDSINLIIKGLESLKGMVREDG